MAASINGTDIFLLRSLVAITDKAAFRQMFRDYSDDLDIGRRETDYQVDMLFRITNYFPLLHNALHEPLSLNSIPRYKLINDINAKTPPCVVAGVALEIALFIDIAARGACEVNNWVDEVRCLLYCCGILGASLLTELHMFFLWCIDVDESRPGGLAEPEEVRGAADMALIYHAKVLKNNSNDLAKTRNAMRETPYANMIAAKDKWALFCDQFEASDSN